MNHYNYTNVPIDAEHMTNLSSNDLEEAIKIYRRQAHAHQEADQREDSRFSGQSRRPVFDRTGDKSKKKNPSQ